jgi:hypothetical protein
MLLPEAIRRELSTRVKKPFGSKLSMGRDPPSSLKREQKSRLFSDRETNKLSEINFTRALPGTQRVPSVPQADLSHLSASKEASPQILPTIKIKIGLTPVGSKRLLSPQSGTRS